ncbi:SurA N-terminal domain-containing protein [Bermanella sp. WJH001]|uniref:SurA N-terminal domain-containing protein n=1 Tax=Bermanella sp. WJH001 TaxID=3048005 RepID=UPI0024BDFF85|nr:SurA N-terminal domain-containing protein [Bermanella sp. WJH001]MDJ1537098.1 SurA N-terminal domain-containing protein [Bermanella sp. WJH001]
MLQAIRDGSKGVAAKIIVGLIILTFALFGIESIVALGGGEDAPAEVNGEEITEYQVQQMVQMQKRRLQAQFGENFDPSMIKDEMLRESALESLINEALFKQAAANAGVYFSDAAIDRIILQSPEFQVNGQFNRDSYDLALRSAGFTRSTYRELLRTSLSTQQAQNAWQGSSFATPYEAKLAAKLESQERDFSYVEFLLADAKKEVSVSDEEIADFYEQNKAQYMTQDKVSINYVELKRDDLAKNISISEDEVAERYSEMEAQAASKKEYRAAHILLLSSDEAAQKTMTEIQGKLSSGEAFEDLAKEYSEDDTSKYAGGDLGFANDEIYEDAFAQALSGLQKDQVSEVVETRDGLHLIKLLDVRQPELAAFEALKDSIEDDLRQEAVQVEYLEALETLKDEAFSSNNIDVPAKALNLTIKTEGPFSEVGGKGVAANRQVIMSAFSDVVLNDGSNSEVIELSDGHAVVIHLNEFIESTVKPLADVKTQINSQLVNRKASELVEQQAEEAIAKAVAGEYTATWQSVKNKTREFTGAQQQIVQAAFALPLNAGNGSFKLVDTKAGNKALVRLDAINRDVVIAQTDDELQKVSRTKSYNEYKAFYQHQLDGADIDKN